MKKLLFAFLLLTAPACFAQGVRVSPPAITEQGTIATVTNAVIIPASPIVKFCNSPANAVPCSNLATTYTDATLGTPCATSTQIVLDGTTTCVSSPDSQNNWGVWVSTGNYTYTVTIPGYGNFGPYYVTAGVSASGTAAAHTFYGNNTASSATRADTAFPGSDKQIYFNDSGALGATSLFTFDKSTGNLILQSPGPGPGKVFLNSTSGAEFSEAGGVTFLQGANTDDISIGTQGNKNFLYINGLGSSSPGLVGIGGGGTPGSFLLNDGTTLGIQGPTISTGTGSPESAVTARVGSLYLRTDGGMSTTLYVKESGTGNTGWVAK